MLDAMKEFLQQGYLSTTIHIQLIKIMSTTTNKPKGWGGRTYIKTRDRVFPTTHLKVEDDFWF